MNKHKIALIANIIIILSKLQSSFFIIKTTGDPTKAIIPLAASVFLIIASIMIWKRNKYGILISIPVICFFILQFFLLRLVQKMIIYFLIHLIAVFCNASVWMDRDNLKLKAEVKPRTHDEKGDPITWNCPECDCMNPNDSFVCKQCGYSLK